MDVDIYYKCISLNTWRFSQSIYFHTLVMAGTPVNQARCPPDLEGPWLYLTSVAFVKEVWGLHRGSFTNYISTAEMVLPKHSGEHSISW